MEEWGTFTVAGVTLLWTVIAFFVSRKHQDRLAEDQRVLTERLANKDQFTQRLQAAMLHCYSDDLDEMRGGLQVLSSLVRDPAASKLDRELARRMAQEVIATISRRTEGSGT